MAACIGARASRSTCVHICMYIYVCVYIECMCGYIHRGAWRLVSARGCQGLPVYICINTYVCVCIYIYMYIYIVGHGGLYQREGVKVYMFTYMYVYTCVCIYRMYVCVYTSWCMAACIGARASRSTYVHICKYIYMCVYVYVCVYIP